MSDAEDKETSDDPSAALMGTPVDPGRPEGMSREAYRAAGPGERTRNAMRTSGVVRRKQRVTWLAVVAVAIAIAGALALFYA